MIATTIRNFPRETVPTPRAAAWCDGARDVSRRARETSSRRAEETSLDGERELLGGGPRVPGGRARAVGDREARLERGHGALHRLRRGAVRDTAGRLERQVARHQLRPSRAARCSMKCSRVPGLQVQDVAPDARGAGPSPRGAYHVGEQLGTIGQARQHRARCRPPASMPASISIRSTRRALGAAVAVPGSVRPPDLRVEGRDRERDVDVGTRRPPRAAGRRGVAQDHRPRA